MSKTLSDADLDAGLDEAKKKPRYFAIIVKGQTIVKMIVQKKRIKDGDVQYAKREFKGNAAILGVCTRSGAEMVLQVENEEPTLKTIKVKEFITEQTGATVKPQWQVVATLSTVPDDDFDVPPAVKKEYDAPPPATLGRAPPEVRAKPVDPNDHYAEPHLQPKSQASAADDEEDDYADIELRTSGEVQSPRADQTPVAPPLVQQPVIPAPPVAPPQASAAPNTKNGKVRAALEKAMPKIDLAKEIMEKGKPDKPISERLARIKALLDDTTQDKSDLAMSEFRALVAFIAPFLENRGAVPKKDQSKRLVELQQSRNLWDAARKKLHARLQEVAAAVIEECSNPEEYDLAEVKEGVRKLDELMEHLNDSLIVVLDQALNANDLAARDTLEQQAGELVREYMLIVENHPLVEAIDENGLVNVSIRDTMGKVLQELERRLAT